MTFVLNVEVLPILQPYGQQEKSSGSITPDHDVQVGSDGDGADSDDIATPFSSPLAEALRGHGNKNSNSSKGNSNFAAVAPRGYRSPSPTQRPAVRENDDGGNCSSGSGGGDPSDTPKAAAAIRAIDASAAVAATAAASAAAAAAGVNAGRTSTASRAASAVADCAVARSLLDMGGTPLQVQDDDAAEMNFELSLAARSPGGVHNLSTRLQQQQSKGGSGDVVGVGSGGGGGGGNGLDGVSGRGGRDGGGGGENNDEDTIGMSALLSRARREAKEESKKKASAAAAAATAAAADAAAAVRSAAIAAATTAAAAAAAAVATDASLSGAEVGISSTADDESRGDGNGGIVACDGSKAAGGQACLTPTMPTATTWKGGSLGVGATSLEHEMVTAAETEGCS